MLHKTLMAIIATVSIIGSPSRAVSLDGNAWKKMPDVAQRAYIMGIIDTWALHVELEKRAAGPTSIYTKIVDCMTDKMPYSQVVAIVRKWMQENPASWHYDMASLVWGAMNDTCKRAP